MLSKGHWLLVGVPGLAKTLLISTLAQVLKLKFNRIQFTPDLMPSDITGTEVIEEDMSTGKKGFKFIQGPVFVHIQAIPGCVEQTLVGSQVEVSSKVG